MSPRDVRRALLPSSCSRCCQQPATRSQSPRSVTDRTHHSPQRLLQVMSATDPVHHQHPLELLTQYQLMLRKKEEQRAKTRARIARFRSRLKLPLEEQEVFKARARDASARYRATRRKREIALTAAFGTPPLYVLSLHHTQFQT
ncbi:hypothetical protein C8F04DRAFT_1195836 [Mycena alexandri]|uniref:Uncharacterized protein n=1 Tax=Mycena alexandri TaxID=1745969 RepID=A0AAD6S5Y8_9AGAR|nr:hypothetical protein C8F04DRAFT_1195836 [Mycena alexandri]